MRVIELHPSEVSLSVFSVSHDKYVRFREGVDLRAYDLMALEYFPYRRGFDKIRPFTEIGVLRALKRADRVKWLWEKSKRLQILNDSST